MMKRHEILSSKGYWEESERTPEEIADKVKEAINNVLQEAAEKVKEDMIYIDENTTRWESGYNRAAHNASKVVLSLIPKTQKTNK